MGNTRDHNTHRFTIHVVPTYLCMICTLVAPPCHAIPITAFPLAIPTMHHHSFPQCNHCAVTLSTKEKRRCAVLSLPPDVHIAEVQALYAIPPAGPAKEPTWWIEYCSLYRVDQVKQLHEETVMSQDTWQGEEQRTTRTDMEDCLSSNSSQRRPLMLPPDVDQSNELIRGTCRKHARVDAVQGEVVVRKSKAGMGALRLRGAGGAGGLYYRMGYDEQTGQLVTDRPVSDFAS